MTAPKSFWSQVHDSPTRLRQSAFSFMTPKVLAEICCQFLRIKIFLSGDHHSFKQLGNSFFQGWAAAVGMESPSWPWPASPGPSQHPLPLAQELPLRWGSGAALLFGEPDLLQGLPGLTLELPLCFGAAGWWITGALAEAAAFPRTRLALLAQVL